jgi:hypothetical protein
MPSTLSPAARRVAWTLQLLVAALLVQTLYFKFTGAPESVYIFTKLGAEPGGRIGTGVVELIVAVLLVVPATAAVGALLALGVISGALFAHLTKLGIVVQDDGGLLFGIACAVFAGSAVVVWLRRTELPWIGARLLPKGATR